MRKTLQGILLIAGTTIGGAMLALPVVTGLAGFFPSMLVYLLCWLFMASTGLLFVELCSWMDKEANLITMARRTLGWWGTCVAWALYIFLFYSLILAYLVGSGDLVAQLFDERVSEWVGAVLFAMVTAPLIFVGPRAVSPLNVLFMLGLGISYVLFIILGAPYVNHEMLAHHDWSQIFLGLPIAFTAFAYQGTVPTVFNFVERNVSRARTAVLVGSFLPFIAYIIWQWLILGIVPVTGEDGLLATLESGGNAVKPLKHFIQNPAVFLVGEFFAFFALITSFFGVSLGLIDFLADGLKIKRTTQGRVLLCLVLFVPPLTIAYVHPHLFLAALNYAGGIGCALLLGLLPICMVWSGRYRMGHTSEIVLPGGKKVLILLALFALFELACDLLR